VDKCLEEAQHQSDKNKGPQKGPKFFVKF